MKAAQLATYGAKDAIVINETEKPKPASRYVLVATKAAGVNPFDVAVRSGIYKESIILELPATLGSDVAGVVEELGEDVTGYEVGQEVYGMASAVKGQGSFAEFTPVSVKQLVAKPKNVDFVSAAALPLASSSAYQGIVDHIGAKAGQKILIHGGAGGIGAIAVQIAKNTGAYVATTVSTDDVEYAKQLGADEVVDYKTQDFSDIVVDYDAVFDTVGGETNKKSYQVLKHGGILVSMVDPFNEDLVKATGINYIQQNTVTSVETLNKITEFVDSGKLKVNVDKVFPLDQAAEALEYLKTGHPRGKVVLSVAIH